MHALPFLHTEVIGLCFDGIKLWTGAKLGPRVWRGGGGEKAGAVREREVEVGRELGSNGLYGSVKREGRGATIAMLDSKWLSGFPARKRKKRI